MSTRATIHFQRNGTTQAIVYRHFDGYPDGLGADLNRFLARLPKDARSNDPGALAAMFVVRQRNTDISIVQKDPGDIEYRYLVNCEGREIPEVQVESLDE